MRGIILLEGQDQAGKTTLANHLIETYGAAYFHATFRKDSYWSSPARIHLYHWSILFKAYQESRQRLVVIDRLWMSESVYGPIFRNNNMPAYGKPFKRFLEEVGAVQVICTAETPAKAFGLFSNKRREEMWTNLDGMEAVCWIYWAMYFGDPFKLVEPAKYASYPKNNLVWKIIRAGGLRNLPRYYAYDYANTDMKDFAQYIAAEATAAMARPYGPPGSVTNPIVVNTEEYIRACQTQA